MNEKWIQYFRNTTNMSNKKIVVLLNVYTTNGEQVTKSINGNELLQWESLILLYKKGPNFKQRTHKILSLTTENIF